MLCTRCGSDNPENAAFCEKCGNPLMVAQSQTTSVCRTCGAAVSSEMKFCDMCGTPVMPNPAMNMQAPQNNTADISAQPMPNQYNNYVQPQPNGYGYYGMPNQVQQIPVRPPKPPKPKKPPMSKKKKITIIASSVLAATVVIALIVFLSIYMSRENRIMRAYEAGNYDEMYELYDGKENKSLNKKLIEKAEEIKAAFIDESKSYQDACDDMNAIRKMGIDEVNEELSEISLFISSLNTSRTNYKTAEKFYKEGDYVNAMSYYKLVIEDDKNYEDAQSKKTASADKYRESILKEVGELEKSGNLEAAIRKISEALAVLKEDSKLTAKKNDLEGKKSDDDKKKLLEKADAKASEGDYLEALKILRNGLETYKDDVQLSGMYEDYCVKYVESILDKVNELVNDKKHSEAIAELNEALEFLPDNTDLKERLEEVEASKPVPLNSELLINGRFDWNSGDPVDPFQNDYSSVNNYAIVSPDSNAEIAEYRVYGKYSTISGVIAPYKDLRDGFAAYVQIYADGELVYTSKNVTRKTDAFRFNKSIKGADYIEIRVSRAYAGSGWSYYGTPIILSNVMLNP